MFETCSVASRHISRLVSAVHSILKPLMGRNYWSYGVEANRKELELVMRYTHEQGLAKRRLEVDEIFHPSTLKLSET